MFDLETKIRKLSPLKWALLGAVGALLVAFTLESLSENLSASFSTTKNSTYVEIDGQSFGAFNKIQGLKNLESSDQNKHYTIVSLNRNFVTDRSLYQWAKSTTRNRGGLKDIHLVTKTPSGEEISRFVLKLSRPLSWSLEAADPSMGGFHENVEFAVQEIAIF